MLKWGGIAFAIGLALCISDYYMATKKKEGIQAADKNRIFGLFWVTLVVTGIVMGLIWMSQD